MQATSCGARSVLELPVRPVSNPLVQSVLVVGGGVAGLVAARVLERHAFACTVVEQRVGANSGGAGLMLWPTALRALGELGFDASALGTPVRHSILRDHRGRTLLKVPLGLRRAALPRAATREALMNVLRAGLGGAVRTTSCRALERHGEVYRAILSDGATLDADAVVIAEGMRSSLRASVAPAARVRSCRRHSWRGLAAFDDPELASGVCIETLGRGLRVGLFPVGPGRVYWFVQRNEDERSPRLRREDLPGLLEGWPAPIRAVVAASEDVIETSIDELLPQPAWVRDGLLLVGDAAHGMTPDLGRGACTAITNLRAFDRALDRCASFRDAARAYARRQGWRTLLVQHGSRIAGSVRQAENATLCATRNAFWRFAPPLLLLRLLTPLLTRHLQPPGPGSGARAGA